METVHGICADGSRATPELGLAYTPLEEGLRKTIAWHWEEEHLNRKPTWLTQSAVSG